MFCCDPSRGSALVYGFCFYFDFEEAQKKLGEAEDVLRSDFFLVSAADAFVEAARHLISESYCKIHQRIDIKYVTENEYCNLGRQKGY